MEEITEFEAYGKIQPALIAGNVLVPTLMLAIKIYVAEQVQICLNRGIREASFQRIGTYDLAIPAMKQQAKKAHRAYKIDIFDPVPDEALDRAMKTVWEQSIAAGKSLQEGLADVLQDNEAQAKCLTGLRQLLETPEFKQAFAEYRRLAAQRVSALMKETGGRCRDTPPPRHSLLEVLAKKNINLETAFNTVDDRPDWGVLFEEIREQAAYSSSTKT